MTSLDVPTVGITVIDAFTTVPFAGNPAAVCLLDEPAPESWMRAVAAEMNLSETAYLVPAGEHRWALRWFTPEAEVDLCGHATLASARFLADAGAFGAGDTARFDTRSGELRARLDGGRVVLDFPATPAAPTDPPAGLLEALGLAPDQVVAVGRGDFFVLVEVARPAEVTGLEPDPRALRGVDTRATIVTAPGGVDGADITSRVFGPAVGIDEDPVTGSAHCMLGPWWAPRLGTTIQAHQASARSGRMEVRVLDDRVELVGDAVAVSWGEIVGP
jgi:PhzF family phenazine biosynthesis protein